jgi:hypothetical protein
VIGGSSLSGNTFNIPSDSVATGILNLSGHPAGGSASSFQGILNIGQHGVGDVEVSAGANVDNKDTLKVGDAGVGTIHLFRGADLTVAPPTLTVEGGTEIGYDGGKGMVAVDQGTVDFKDFVFLGENGPINSSSTDTLRITGGSVLMEDGLYEHANSCLDLEGGLLHCMAGVDAFSTVMSLAHPLIINGAAPGPTLTLSGGYGNGISTTSPLSLLVAHDAYGTLNYFGDDGQLTINGNVDLADLSTGVGRVNVDSTAVFRVDTLQAGPGSGSFYVQNGSSISASGATELLATGTTGGSIYLGSGSEMSTTGLAIAGTFQAPTPGPAFVQVNGSILNLYLNGATRGPLQVWSGGQLLLQDGSDAAVDSGVVSGGEIQLAASELDSVTGSPSVIHLRNGGSLHGFGIVRHRIVLDDSTASIGTLTGDTLSGSPSKVRTLAAVPDTLTVGDSTGTGSLVLGGMVRVESGTVSLLNHGVLDLGPHVIMAGGTLNVPHGGHVGASGVLEGYGTLVGNISVDGTLRAQGTLSGALTLNGHIDFGPKLARLELANAPTLAPTNVLTMRIGSAAHGAQDTLVVDQPLSLNGTLDLRTWQPDPSQPGDTLTLISAPSISGTFSAVTIDGVNAPSYTQVIYEPTRVRVAVLQSTTSVPTGPKTGQPIVLRFATEGSLVNPVLALDLPSSAEVHLTVYNVAGRRIADLAQGQLPAGRYRYPFAAGTPGVYFGRAWIRDSKGTHQLNARIARIP